MQPKIIEVLEKEIYINNKDLLKIDDWEIRNKKKSNDEYKNYAIALTRLPKYQQLVRLGYFSCIMHSLGFTDVEFPNFGKLMPQLLTRFDMDLLYEIYIYGQYAQCVDLSKHKAYLIMHKKDFVGN